jgi:hypothetical protein
MPHRNDSSKTPPATVPARDSHVVHSRTPAALARRFGLRPFELREVLSAVELRTIYRYGHQVLDTRTVLAAWLDVATAPSRRGGGR